MGGMAEDPGNADVLRAVREVDWAAYPMPSSEPWYELGDIPAVFRRLVAVSNQQDGGAAYSAVLFAIGNNHAGYLFPAAAPAPMPDPRALGLTALTDKVEKPADHMTGGNAWICR